MAPAAAAKVSGTETLASDPTKSADLVLVGCKLPHGFIMEIVSPGMLLGSEGKPIQGMNPSPVGQRIEIKGANSLRERTDRAAPGRYDYAVTPVPSALWDAWFARNKDLEWVKKGFVFAAPSLKDAKAEAKEKQDERTGLEALAPEKDPRIAQAGRIGGMTVEGDPESYQRALAAPT